jgi:nucleoside-diphosphate-sugar epimerase
LRERPAFIGRPLIRYLNETHHTVFGLARSPQSGRTLAESGAERIGADALDAASIMRVRPHPVINELTSLPTHYTPEEMRAAAERDHKVRTQGNLNLLAALLAKVPGCWSGSARRQRWRGRAYGASATNERREAEPTSWTKNGYAEV